MSGGVVEQLVGASRDFKLRLLGADNLLFGKLAVGPRTLRIRLADGSLERETETAIDRADVLSAAYDKDSVLLRMSEHCDYAWIYLEEGSASDG